MCKTDKKTTYFFAARQNAQQKPTKFSRGNELILQLTSEDKTKNFHSCFIYNGQHLRKQWKIKAKNTSKTNLKTRNEIITSLHNKIFPGEGVLWEFLGGDVLLGPWNP